MLNSLTIKNYALIRELEMEFTNGLTVITGETGAGKSIILGAVGLILGERADTSVIFDKGRKCVIEGKFFIRDYGLDEFFETNDLDFYEQSILRREISPNGRSRAFINDTPVNLSEMKELGEKLLNVHSQQETIILNDSSFQMAIVDSFAGTQKKVKDYNLSYRILNARIREYDIFTERANRAKSDQDYYQFQLDELSSLGLEKIDQTGLEEELKLLNNSEEIKAVLFDLCNILEKEDNSVLSTLKTISNRTSKLKGINKEIDSIIDRLDSLCIEVKDISGDAASIENQVEIDQERLEMINEKLDLIYSLQQKHNVSDVNGLIQVFNDFEEKLGSIGKLDDKIERLQREITELDSGLRKTAEDLSEKRRLAIPTIEKEIVNMLGSLGMSGAEFSIQQKVSEELGMDGFDHVTFLFNANRGGELQKVSKVASGGELSRLMLAMKSMIARENLIPTIIFDEIDSGVSGDIAGKVGKILKMMGENIQVIAITHLPQIAGMGNSHYKVYKEMDKSTTYSRIKLLSSDERIDEMAQLISGEKVTQQAIDAAKELLYIENKN